MNEIKDIKILIIGANFINKGAQSMLFISVDEIKKRFPAAQIYFATFEENIDFSFYSFNTIYYNSQAVQIALNPKAKKKIVLKTKIKNTLKYLAGKKYRKYILPIPKFFILAEQIHKFSLIIDVSGFGLGSKWGIAGSEEYLDNLRLAHKYNIPIFLMPQSFGPFNYEKTLKTKIYDDIKEVLGYASLIFARENEGYKLLTKDFGLTNVKKSYDLVLQNKGICLDNIFKTIPEKNVPQLLTKENIAIIPNVQCFRNGKKSQIMNMYQNIITEALDKQNNIYLIYHSSEDRNLCLEIKSFFEKENCVHFLDQDFSCIEYDILIKQFKYIICSRFHGVVHAYRNFIPCIILGWAVKYKELAACVNQVDYCFDITNLDDSQLTEIIYRLTKMDHNYHIEGKIIEKHLKSIQKDNCFDKIILN